MTFDEYKQELADLESEYDEEIDYLEDRIYRLRSKYDAAAIAVEEKYIQANRKYSDGHKDFDGIYIVCAMLIDYRIRYTLSDSSFVYEDSIV